MMNLGDKIETLPAGHERSPANAIVKPLASSSQLSSSGFAAGASYAVLLHYKDRANALLQVSTFAATITFTIILTPRDNGQTTPGLVQLAYANALFCGAIVGSVFVIIGIEIANAQQGVMRELGTFRWEKVKQEAEAEQEVKVEVKAELRVSGGSVGMAAAKQGQKKRIMDLVPVVAVITAFLLRNLLSIVHVVASLVGLSLYAAFYIMIYATRLFLQYNGPFILGTVIYVVLGILAIAIWIGSLFLEQEYVAKLFKPDEGIEDSSRGVKESISKRQFEV